MDQEPHQQDEQQVGKYETGPITSTQYHQAMIMAGSATHHSRISIEKISGNALIGSDIWGTRAGESYANRFQPIYVSARISLLNPFHSAAEYDKLNESTINYSTLSKQIQKVIASRGSKRGDAQGWRGTDRDWSLYEFLNWTFVYLTGASMEGQAPDASMAHDYLQGGCPCLEEGPDYLAPFLKIETLQELELQVTLPKATLLSSGVSLIASRGFPYGLTSKDSAPYRIVLRIDGMRIPTLIGVNSNERLAKQIVVGSVEVDPYITSGSDFYNELEQIMVKSLEESAFETLESLSIHLVKRVIKHFVYQFTPRVHSSRVRIVLRKPSAVTFAETPVVEVDWSSDPSINPRCRSLWDEFEATPDHPKIPYPLDGRLDHWLVKNFPGDTTGVA